MTRMQMPVATPAGAGGECGVIQWNHGENVRFPDGVLNNPKQSDVSKYFLIIETKNPALTREPGNT
jgi:hypothetical protein